jgi:Dual specificity phosphatase, catalytic domain
VREPEAEGAIRIPPELRPRSTTARIADDVLRFGRKGFARIAELSPTRLNLSWITPNLALGGAIHTRDIPRLRQLGITAVVDCREEASDDELALARNGIDFLRLPTIDATSLSQDSLDRGVEWVRGQMMRGARIYIHCSHGVGRAPELGACVLFTEGHTAADALAIVRAKRWQASPNEEQVLGLLEYAQRHRPSRPPFSLGQEGSPPGGQGPSEEGGPPVEDAPSRDSR